MTSNNAKGKQKFEQIATLDIERERKRQKVGSFFRKALDYVFLRGFTPAAPPWIVSGAGISDHDAVFVNLAP